MIYTIKSAHYANPQHTAAVIDTVEDATVAISIQDTPLVWQQMLACGVDVTPYKGITRRDAHPGNMGKPFVIRAR